MSADKTTALVTGASSGIGAEFCRQLAERCDVIIATGRQESALSAIAAELEGMCEVHCVAADLALLEGRTRVVECLRQKGPVDYLVNNAGFSTLGGFADLELDAQQDMVRVHIDASMTLCRAAIPFMKERGGGAIVNVSSTASFVPFAKAAVYGASKAFLNYFSEALQRELADHGIRVQSLCPGYTITGFHDRDAMAAFDRSRVPGEEWMEVAEVVRISLSALEDGPVVVIPGEHNRGSARKALKNSLAALESTPPDS